jgi:hypothetical protein
LQTLTARSPVFFPLVSALRFGSLLCFAAAALGALAADAPRPIELFKSFIANPPAISNLVFTEELPNAPIAYHRIKWQNPSVYVGWGNSPFIPKETALTNYTEWVGHFGNIFYLKSLNAFYTWTNSGDPAEVGNTVEIAHQKMMGLVTAGILNMGCQMAPVGGIRWEGDSFVLTNQANDRAVQGKVFADAEGRAGRMLVTAVPVGTPFSAGVEMECSYEYDGSHSVPFLPGTIAVKSSAGKAPFNYKHRILALELATAPLAASDFLTVPSDADRLVHVRITNKYRLYTKRYNGRTNLTASLDQQHAAVITDNVRRQYWAASATFLLLPIILLYMLHRRKISQNKQDNIGLK